MSEEAKQESEHNQEYSVIGFEDYRITDHRNAPAGARALLCTLGGYKYYKGYVKSYNELIDVVKESVLEREMTRKDALACLEECRNFD